MKRWCRAACRRPAGSRHVRPSMSKRETEARSAGRWSAAVRTSRLSSASTAVPRVSGRGPSSWGKCRNTTRSRRCRRKRSGRAAPQSTAPQSTVRTSTAADGSRARARAVTSGRAGWGTAPMRRRSAAGPGGSPCAPAASSRSTTGSSSSAQSSSSRPAAVRRAPRWSRRRTTRPVARSARWIRRLTPAWLRPSARAAPARLPVSATARSTRRSWISTSTAVMRGPAADAPRRGPRPAPEPVRRSGCPCGTPPDG